MADGNEYTVSLGSSGNVQVNDGNLSRSEGNLIQNNNSRRRRARGKKGGGQNLSQSTLPFGSSSTPFGVPPTEDFGDSFIYKAEGTTRIGNVNVNNFEVGTFENSKMDHFREFIRRYDFDVIGLQEHGLNLKRIPRCKRFDYLLRTENLLRVEAAHNVHEPGTARRQWGGTAVLAMGETATRITESGSDSTGLGRWTWFRFEGKGGVSTRIVSAYQPVPSDYSHGWTVNAQHHTYFNSKGDFTNPRAAMLRDLEQVLRRWRNDGDRIVLCIDMNDDMTNSPMQRMLSSEGLDMREAALARYPDLPKTSTYMKPNGTVGKRPLDGIWLTPDLPDAQSGWLSFPKSFDDHRTAIVDIDTKVLFGENVLKIVRPPARRLATNIPKALTQYQTHLSRHMSEHKVLQKLHEVYGRSVNSLTTQQTTAMTKIDKIRREGMIHAEKKCRKLAMGEVDCSPKIMASRQMVRLWRLIVRHKRGLKTSRSLIKRKARRCHVENPLSCTLREAEMSLKRVVAEYNDLKPKAKQLRQEFLYDRANDYSEKSDETKRKHAKRLLREEQQREAARMIRRVMGKQFAGSVDWVEEEVDGVTVRVEGKEAVEEKIMQNNEKRFRLTETTPMMRSPMKEVLGYLSATDAAQQILDGTFRCPSEVDSTAADFIHSLRITHPNPTEVSSSVTLDDYKSYWKRAKERTSSSMSGLHFGHWKACASDDTLSEINAIFTEITISTGYSPPRWQNGLSVMLEKVEGVRNLDKLRAILLMEADYNFANKLIFGKRMIEQADDNDEIPWECFAKSHHRAIQVAIGRCHVMDNVRQKRIPAALMAVDAQTCYDRIAHAIASLCAQRLGVAIETIVSLLLTIQLMKFFLRTAFGDSDRYYGGGSDSRPPFQGICQGNGGGPGVWLVVSACLVRMLHERGCVAILTRAITGIKFRFAGFLYVDDTDLIVTAKHRNDTAENVAARSQAAVYQWAGGLNATGGALRPDKCSWCLIDFVWRNGKWQYRSNDCLAGSLMIPGPDGAMTEIKRLEPSEPIKVVGVVQAADGSMQGQFEATMGRIEELGERLRDGCITRKLAWQGFHSTIWSSLKYPLPACNFSSKQADELTVRLYKHVLPSLGTSKSFPNAYRFAPKSLQGLAAPNFYVDMNIEKTSFVLGHGDTPTLSGHLMGSVLEQAQIEIGSGTPLLLTDFAAYGCLVTDCWFKGLWEFVSMHDIKLECDDYPMPHLQREHDEFVMDKLISLRKFDKGELAAFNRCRLRMEVLTMADIIEGDGSSLRWDVSAWSPAHGYFSSSYEWPNEQPSTKDWAVWRKGLRYLTSDSGTLDYLMSLGDWITTPHKLHEWFYSPSERRVYRRIQRSERYLRYRPSHGTSTRRPTFTCDGISSDLPADACYATARKRSNYVRLHSWAENYFPDRPQPQSIHEVIDRLSAHWPLNISNFTHSQEVATSIRNGTATAVSDGSYMAAVNPELGTASWIIESDTGLSVNGVVQTSGMPKEVNAYRSELQGIHANMMALKAICEFHGIEEGKATVCCDNEKGIYLADCKWVHLALRTKHADLIQAIRRLAANLPIEIEFRHVGGHQDKHKDFHELSRPSQLNVMMDHEAKRYLRHLLDMEYRPSVPTAIHGEGWRCTIDGSKATSCPGEAIRTAVYSDEICTHLHKHKGLSPEKFPCIDWEANGDALSSAPTLFSLWLTKHVSGCCGIGKMMHRWKFWDDPKCHSCDALVETIPHLCCCPHPDRVLAWEEAVEDLDAWLLASKTAPSIRRCIVETLRRRDQGTRFADFADDFVLEAATDQDEIGWIHFVEGRISRKWREVQQEHFLLHGSQRSARKWSEDLVMNMFSLVHKQWEVRNAVVHARDEKGLKVKEGDELRAAIAEQFELGDEDLRPEDRHYIARGKKRVDKMSGSEQKTWLHGIRIAREAYEMEVDSEITRLRNSMYGWLRRL